MRFQCYNIQWDTDGDEFVAEGIAPVIELELDEHEVNINDADTVETMLGDMLSDETGWCQLGFEYKQLPPESM